MRSQHILLLAFALAVPRCLSATIHRVPEDFDTIQDAINAARTGDTVLVSPGTYYENLTFQGKALALGSLTLTTGDTAYVSWTIIDGSDAGNPDSASTLYICDQPDTLSQVVGFTITGGQGIKLEEFPDTRNGGGIAIRWSRVSVHDCHIVDNGPVFSGGGLVLIGGGLKVRQCRFRANFATFGGAFTTVYGSIECHGCEICYHYDTYEVCWVNSCDFCIRDCSFHHNYVAGNSAFTAASSSGLFVDNRVHHNTAYGPLSSCVVFGNGSEVNIDSNEIWQNEGTVCTIGLGSTGPCSLRWNFIHDNSVTENAGGLFGSGREAYQYIYQNSFVGNVGGYGGAVCAGGLWLAEFVGNYFESNQATSPAGAGALACIQPSHVLMRRNIIEFNDSLAVGGEILVDPLHRAVDAIENFWGHPSGPHHPVLNPDGLGNAAGDCVRFIPWLLEPPAGTDRPHAPSPIPQTFVLLDPYPNPFNPGVTLPLSVTVPGDFKLEVFDLLGRLIWSHTERFTTSGIHRVYWPGIASDGRAIASGVYFARASTNTQSSPARKLVLLK